MDSAAEPGKYEEENKHSAHFYPIPVSVCLSVWNDANHRVRNNACYYSDSTGHCGHVYFKQDNVVCKLQP